MREIRLDDRIADIPDLGRSKANWCRRPKPAISWQSSSLRCRPSNQTFAAIAIFQDMVALTLN
jgi:hypothetical protein